MFVLGVMDCVMVWNDGFELCFGINIIGVVGLESMVFVCLDILMYCLIVFVECVINVNVFLGWYLCFFNCWMVCLLVVLYIKCILLMFFIVIILLFLIVVVSMVKGLEVWIIVLFDDLSMYLGL